MTRNKKIISYQIIYQMMHLEYFLKKLIISDQSLFSLLLLSQIVEMAGLPFYFYLFIPGAFMIQIIY